MKLGAAIATAIVLAQLADQASAEVWPNYCQFSTSDGDVHFIRTEKFLIMDLLGITGFKCSSLFQCEGETWGSQTVFLFEREETNQESEKSIVLDIVGSGSFTFPESGVIKRVSTFLESGKVDVDEFTFTCQEFPHPWFSEEIVLPSPVYGILLDAIRVYPSLVDLLSETDPE